MQVRFGDLIRDYGLFLYKAKKLNEIQVWLCAALVCVAYVNI